jgi:glycosyltransferase involved in cell wall biosynthesis
MGYSLALRRFFRNSEFDVVVAASLKAIIFSIPATFGLRQRLVWSVHDRVTREYLGLPWLAYSYLVPRLVDAIIANSQSTLDTLQRVAVPVLIAPPAQEVPSIKASIPRKTRGRVLLLGRLAPWKGQDLALRALARLSPDQIPQVDVVGAALFGEDGYACELRELVLSLGLANRVTLHGHVDNPRTLLEQADILVHSSVIPEPFGSVVVEGMSAGCIVIATRPGGPEEVIDDADDGFLIDAGDDGAIEAALRRALSLSPDESESMRRAARLKCLKFDASITAAETSSFLRAVLENVGHKRSVHLWSEGYYSRLLETESAAFNREAP